jgi:dinuclear metal center YbgI/SA1388 family protein
MIKIKDITACLEELAPLSLQESYDNCGLLCGNAEWEASSALLSLDCTEEIVDEAIEAGCNLIIAHHPVVFSGLKKITGSNYVERTLIKAIQHNIAIYACHTNLDNVKQGVNQKIAEKLGLRELKVLSPKTGQLRKLVTFVPASHLTSLRNALFQQGAGHIGNYDSCSFSQEGTGTFRGNELSKPFLGKPMELSQETEVRLELIYETAHEQRMLETLKTHHPYEEPAFDCYPISNAHPGIGSGMLGSFESSLSETEFLTLVKTQLKAAYVRHTPFLNKPIKTVAFCGGSGRFLLNQAIARKADAFVTADFKYHDFFDVEGRLLLADPGHFETEQFTPEIFYGCIQNKFPKFAIRLSKINTNPIHYF